MYNFPYARSKLAPAASVGVNFCVKLVTPSEMLKSIQEYVVTIDKLAATEQVTGLLRWLPDPTFAVWHRRCTGLASSSDPSPRQRALSQEPASAFGDSRTERVLGRKPISPFARRAANLRSGELR